MLSCLHSKYFDLKDVPYSINNSVVEWFIHSLAYGRKNSLFFGSNCMAYVLAVYHMLISTYWMNGKPSN